MASTGDGSYPSATALAAPLRAVNCRIGANEATGFQTSPEGPTMEQNRRI